MASVWPKAEIGLAARRGSQRNKRKFVVITRVAYARVFCGAVSLCGDGTVCMRGVVGA